MLHQWTAFQTLVPTLPIIQLSHSVTSLRAFYMQLPVEPKKCFILLFSTYPIVLKTCKNTLMYKSLELPFKLP